jgi:uncharacterized integral membrane protein
MGLTLMLKRQRTQTRGGLHGLGLWWTFTAALVLGAAVIVAILENSRHVTVHYLAWHFSVSLIVVVLVTALIAVLLDEAGGLIWRRRRRSSIGRRSELNQLQAQQHRRERASLAAEPPAARAETAGQSAGPATRVI